MCVLKKKNEHVDTHFSFNRHGRIVGSDQRQMEEGVPGNYHKNHYKPKKVSPDSWEKSQY